MSYLTISGPTRLQGRVRVSGAKNAVLPILAATLLGDGPSTIDDVPDLEDVQVLCHILTLLGCRVQRMGTTLRITPGNLISDAPEHLVRRMRASFLVLGPLLARLGRARVALPGGCAIGSRPVDLHLMGMQALGATIEIVHGDVRARAPRLEGASIYLDFPSVGATENVLLAAVLARGETIIENAAEEPEVVDLCSFLVKMGARIRGAGTKVIHVEGVRSLRGAEHTVIPDRIEAGTFMLGAAITGGDVVVDNARVDHLKALLAKLREAGVEVLPFDSGIRVIAANRPRALHVKTLPYPGFPTDLQAPMMALLTQADGPSIMTETVFEDRFRHVEALRRMGAHIHLDGRSAVITGGTPLHGAEVDASDLRAAAALVLAGLSAEGHTVLHGLEHLDRGYDGLEDKLGLLGARLQRSHPTVRAASGHLRTLPAQ